MNEREAEGMSSFSCLFVAAAALLAAIGVIFAFDETYKRLCCLTAGHNGLCVGLNTQHCIEARDLPF